MASEKKSLTGPEKAAIILIAVGDEIAGKILSELEEGEIHKISSYMSGMGSVAGDTVDNVLEEFIDMSESGGGYLTGGREYLRKMLESSLDPDKANEILERISSPDDEDIGGGLEAVRHLDAATIASFLSHEHPQTCAIILSHLEPQHAASVIKELPERFQPDVMFRIATLERVPPGVVKELDQALATEFRSTGAMEGAQIGGVESAAEIINNMDHTTEVNVLGEIESLNADLAENIRQLMFVFEDILKIDDRGMQGILKEVNSDELILALKTSSEPLKEKVFANMSERAALMMKEDLEAMGPVRLSDVEQAQQAILRTVKRLEEEGKIVLAGGGEELV
ncbi:Flagellar motor switch protein FliG [hydrothermal vent metagenome]|uniref:Flagellar motor switch protein FliG n=1 Tax=hydrothermal vent metagenome TaxID=652676 RepID=A0A3B1C6C0_9ZZZZ